jgi:hypothetical protein
MVALLLIPLGSFRLFTLFLAPLFKLPLFIAPAYPAIIVSVSGIVIRYRLRYRFGFRCRLGFSIKQGFSWLRASHLR